MEEQAQNPQPGDIVSYFSWQIEERVKHDRGRLWYILAGSISLALLFYSILTANFLFAIMIILIVFIAIMREYFPSSALPFAITNKGILIARRLYNYKDLKSFYIIYEPPAIQKLYFEFKGIRPELSIELYDNDPIEIRDFLLRVLDEDLEKESQSMADSLERILKL